MRLVLFYIGASVAVHGVAGSLWWALGHQGSVGYGCDVFGTCVALAIVGCAFMNGPSRVAGFEEVQARSPEHFDIEDRSTAASLGLALSVVAVANAVLGLWIAGAFDGHG